MTKIKRKIYIPRQIKNKLKINKITKIVTKQITETKKIQFQNNKNINITIKSDKPISIYYNIDNLSSMQINKYRYIKVTDHNFTISDNLSNELFITIIKPYNAVYSFDYNYTESIQNKYAIIVGISDYKYVNDLSFCDEDATDWANYLTSLNYKCLIFGDTNTRNYPFYNGLATEDNVRKHMEKISNISNDNTKFAYITSGHGSGDNNGNSYLCMYDYNGLPNGKYTDKEFNNDIQKIKGEKFIFFDHCASGGMLDELQNINNIFATSTCSEKGFGWDMSKYKNGAWTHCFLKKTILEKYKNIQTSLDDIYDYANSIFKSETNKTDQYDQPMKISTITNMYL